MFDRGSNGTQGARSTKVGPCGPGLEGRNMAARSSEGNPGGQVNDGWIVWPMRVGVG